MVKKIIASVCFLSLAVSLAAQDVPLFTQKLTNAFLYNPSVAGNTFGSATLSYRKLWSAIGDAPTTSFVSLHTPFGQHRFGLGVNFFQDEINFSKTIHGSAAFAYHIRITDTHSFSLGVSAEYNNQRLNFRRADVIDTEDPRLNGANALDHVDFSFGGSYRTKFMRIGGSVNRFTNMLGNDSTTSFPAYYTGTLQFMLPLADDRHLLEPIATYRSNLFGAPQFDAGLFYTYNDFATLGGSYRTGGILSATAAIKLNKRLLVGLSRDMFLGEFGQGLGASYEVTVRFDFRDESFYLNSRNSRQINNNAINIRRKTLNRFPLSNSKMKQSAKYKKLVRKKSYMSPNYRMSASKKLMTVKTKRKHYRRR
ncbi:MAG TPA: PorP/SprF family type IX secretion system membrane protein [Ohtaekwangia sp.]|nr:PorP/SprF family type IX secretion system membrane protein [Ohtaekwangia sp.]